MAGRVLSWAHDGLTWPNREASRFVEAGGMTWHVQVAGQGPTLLLLHGTGASTHSWRHLLPRLAERFTVVAPDLPGHAFSAVAPASRMSLTGMALGVAALLRCLGLAPAVAVGHSAGAAIAVQMTLDLMIAPAGLVSLNGALLPLGGLAGQLFSPLAALLAGSETAGSLFAWWAGDKATITRLLAQTGSRLEPRGLALYHRLATDAVHTRAALTMMANWQLAGLERRLPDLKIPLVLVVGTRDGSIPPADADRIKRRVDAAVLERLDGLGHLAHEEDPHAVAELIFRHSAAWNVLDHTSPH